MKRFYAAALLILVTGCVLPPSPPVVMDENEQKYQGASHLLERGKYREARELYIGLADVQPPVSWTEEAKYKAAYILIHAQNPDKDYVQAAREFEAFLIRYPASAHAEDARTWVSMLQNFDQSATNKFIQEVGLLARKLEDVEVRLHEVQEQKDLAVKERNTLLLAKDSLAKRVDDLLIDKDNLLKEKSLLLSSKENLIKENAVLGKRVDVLTKEKENLIQAKEKLERDLNDLKMLDVKMEKKRKKMR